MTQHKDKDEDREEQPVKEKPRPSMGELGKKMDAALRDVDAKRQALDAAKVALDAATKDHGDALAVVSGLKEQYDALMKDVMSVGGTVHVAS
jgi:hypothetical protein